MLIDWESVPTERSVEIPTFFQILKKYKPKTLLDVGFAGGWYHTDVVDLGVEFTGLDAIKGRVFGDDLIVSVEKKLEWKDSLDCIEVIVSDIVEWVSDRQFDMVASISSIEHIIPCCYGMKDRGADADLRAVEKMKTHVKPGGSLCLSFPVGKDDTDLWWRRGPKEFIAYGEERVKILAGDWNLLSEEYWVNVNNKWVKTPAQEALNYQYPNYRTARTLGVIHLGNPKL